MDSGALIVFEDKKIRRTWFNHEWYYSVVDIIAVLTESDRARKYWADLKAKLKSEGSEVSEKIGQLKLPAEDGKLRETDCANTRTLFRLIQSIPSPKAEPFKLWLAEVGYDRVQEIENPELAQDRVVKYYKLKGYSDEWIDKRLRGIAIRQELTDEWKNRGVNEGKEFAILTNEISKATFGVTVKEHKEIKGLDVDRKNQNLRDHMNGLELIFSMLGEAATTNIARAKDAQGFNENETAAKEGGEVANVARKQLESKTGEKIVSSSN